MKKAKIDVLDIEDSFEAVSTTDPPTVEPQIDLQGESFLAVPEEEASSTRSFMNWKTLLLIGIPVLLLLIAIGVYYFVYYDKKPSILTAKGEKTGTAMTAGSPVYFNDLRSTVNDLQGQPRIVLFGFAVTPHGKVVSLNFGGDDRDLRLSASRIVGAMPLSELLHEKGREQVKKKIKAHIEEQKGTGVVGDVWITSWTIL